MQRINERGQGMTEYKLCGSQRADVRRDQIHERRPISQNERGQSLAEFALCLPILLFILLGLLQLASLGASWFSLRHAARSAARAYALHRDQGPEAAREQALENAEEALLRSLPRPAITLEVEEGIMLQPNGPELFRITLRGSQPAFLPFNRHFQTVATALISREGPRDPS